jgi:glycerophosphoryl diester phosphodiesterase
MPHINRTGPRNKQRRPSIRRRSRHKGGCFGPGHLNGTAIASTLKATYGNAMIMNVNFVAHRGYRAAYPENTLIGIQAAIDAGARHIELDIQYSADFEPVIYHDPVMQRVSAVSSRVEDLTEEELRHIPAYEPERLGDRYIRNTVNGLQDLLDILPQFPAVNIFIEVKRSSIRRLGAQFILDDLQRRLAPVAQQCIVISFDQAFVENAAARAFCRTGLVIETAQQLFAESLVACAPDFVFVDVNLLEYYKPLPCPFETSTVVYEVGDTESAKTLIANGFRWLETFDIKLMLDTFGCGPAATGP